MIGQAAPGAAILHGAKNTQNPLAESLRPHLLSEALSMKLGGMNTIF